MTDPGWVVTPKDSPAELAEGYPAPPFGSTAVASTQPELTEPTSLRSRTDWVSIQEKIGAAKMEELLVIFGGYPIDPSTQ